MLRHHANSSEQNMNNTRMNRLSNRYTEPAAENSSDTADLVTSSDQIVILSKEVNFNVKVKIQILYAKSPNTQQLGPRNEASNYMVKFMCKLVHLNQMFQYPLQILHHYPCTVHVFAFHIIHDFQESCEMTNHFSYYGKFNAFP